MHVSDFDFDLPTDLIAQRPAEPRDSARLLHVPAQGAFADRQITDLPSLLQPGDLLVTNDTRVIPARLTGVRGDATHGGPPQGGARIEVTLHKPDSPAVWRAFARPAKKLKPRDLIVFAPGFSAVVDSKGEGGEVTLHFNLFGARLLDALHRHGVMPLPPYIKRDRAGDSADETSYQTLFAENDGAVAAPTASLHYTPTLIDAIVARGVQIAKLTLHVGAGTFLPVRVDDTRHHVMHSEWGELSPETAALINRTKQNGGRIIASGTTVLRLLEAATQADGTVAAFRGETDIFITPGYAFRSADLLLTNFHLPKSTLFMLVAAFSGLARMKDAYQHAMAQNYRFYSYGDATLLELAQNAPKESP
ncbi:MAG: tRNA preQ1(34) S-adenosylmethionine ribosyltransferase-isomerase QueA [Rhodospirillales bacterium]|nr:tRNA preQ1(34) S-adenosylmethionine ribosyltransferase-isomerase QueA [Rhodospirillales bacterium]